MSDGGTGPLMSRQPSSLSLKGANSCKANALIDERTKRFLFILSVLRAEGFFNVKNQVS